MRKLTFSRGTAGLAGFLALFITGLFLNSCARESSLSGIPVSGRESSWTTVVYMAADNDLETAALDDLREMVAGARGLEAAGHTVLVLLDRSSGYDASAGNWTDTRLFRISPASDSWQQDDFSFMQLDCPSLGLTVNGRTELDMGASATLHKLLQFAEDEYQAGSYALILWGHGCGWRGYAVDEDADSVMTLPQLHDAVSGLREPLSVIGFDCCYGAMLETVYELRDDAELFVAAEGDEPAAGWNYTLFLEQLSRQAAPEPGTTCAERYARCAVNAFASQYAAADGVSITAVTLSKAGDVFACFEDFAASCAACLTTREAAVRYVSDILPEAAAFQTGEYPAFRFVDAGSLAGAFIEQGLPSCSTVLTENASVAAERLRQALASATYISFTGGSGVQAGMSEKPMLAVYLATLRQGGVVDTDYPQLYVRGSGTSGQSAFVRDSTGWVPQHIVSQSTSLLDRLYRMPLP